MTGRKENTRERRKREIRGKQRFKYIQYYI
jgi:hypothetical protein